MTRKERGRGMEWTPEMVMWRGMEVSATHTRVDEKT